MRRLRRVHELDAAARAVPLRLYLFDCLLRDGTALVDRPYAERRAALAEVTGGRHLAERRIAADVGAAQAFLDEALAAGHEGLMAKALDSPYTPGVRGTRWFKLKLADRLDCVIMAADRGSGRRRGWLSNYHLAVRDETGGFAEVGKTFKGLTDRGFEAMTARLWALALEDDGYTVRVRPEVVVEVAYNEIQTSPRYPSGFALRFARIARVREDKGPADADTLAALRARFAAQARLESAPAY
jgi:DNA ligase 1